MSTAQPAAPDGKITTGAGEPNGKAEPQENPEPKSIIHTPELLPREAEKALEKLVEEGGPKALLSIFTAVSRTSSMGPDPQTAKVLSEVEINAEECRLKGFQASLQNKNEQSARDHEFRVKRLNHDTLMGLVLLVAGLAGVAAGLWLYSDGHQQLGGYVLLGSFFILQGGRLPRGGGPSGPSGPAA